MPTLTRQNHSVTYEDSGPPPGHADAPTVIFGHGLLFGSWMFDPQVEALSSTYRCVTIGWRGQGGSSQADDYSMDALADDALTLIDVLGVEKVHWVGLSMGGFVGMRLAARRPEKIASLILLSTSAERDDETADEANRELARRFKTGELPEAEDLVPNSFGPDFSVREDRDAIVSRWSEALQASEGAGLAGALLGVVDREPVTEELKRIQAPTLVMSGENDTMPPRLGRTIADTVSSAEFISVPRAGHACTLDKPEFVTEKITRFLADHSPQDR